jgi:hypothetical protein
MIGLVIIVVLLLIRDTMKGQVAANALITNKPLRSQMIASEHQSRG